MRRITLLLAVLTVGCDTAADRTSDITVTDSAGVRIVINAERPQDMRTWRVDEEPDVVIGESTGAPEYLFDRIMEVEQLSDGTWVVADMGSSQIRYYDRDGKHIRSVGRRGEGPGEFSQVMGLHRLAGDTIAVDDSYRRIHFLDPEGRFTGVFTLAGSFVGPRTQPWGAFEDGTVVALSTSAFPQRLTEPHSTTHSFSRVQLSRDQTGAVEMEVVDTIATWEGTRLVPGWRGSAQDIEFDGRLQVALMSDGIAVADPRLGEVRFHDAEGSLHLIARREWTPVPVTDEHVEERREQFLNMAGEGGGAVPPQLIEQRRAISETWVIAEHMPAFSGMLVDAEDNIWLRAYVPNEETVGTWRRAPVQPADWSVIDGEGRVVAEVRMPPRFLPLVIGEDYVAGIHRDDAEVERVHVYRLRR